MELKDVLTVGISCLALLVALYGVYERRAAARYATRLRLSEVLDELNELSVEQAKPLQNEDEHLLQGWTAQINGRREVLCAMAESLVRELDDGVSEREFSTLAVSLRRLGDWAGASRYWERAMSTARRDTAYECFVLRGYAEHQFLCSQPDAGRDLFRRALEVVVLPEDNRRMLRAETYMGWASAETELGGGAETVEPLIRAGEAELDAMRLTVVRARHRHIYDLRAAQLRAAMRT